MELGSPIQFVKGVGPKRADGLARQGISTVEDLLLHLPMRYEDRSQIARIADLQAGTKATIRGVVAAAGARRTRRMPLFEALIDDGSGRLNAIWFNQPYLKDVLERGKAVMLHGKVEPDGAGRRRLIMTSPEYELLADESQQSAHAGRIVPVYEKLGPLSPKVLRRTLAALTDAVPDDLADPLPRAVRARQDLMSRAAALRQVHAPPTGTSLEALNRFRSDAHRRLIFEEFFLFQLGLASRRRERNTATKPTRIVVTDATREAVKRILPFRLTGAQKRVLKEVAEDLQSEHPMNRLVLGDVGSGKTMIALLSMVIAVENGLQAAFMAPTEILAEQHFITIRRLLARCSYRVELLTASRAGKAQALKRIASGEAQIVVGTHALIQERVSFARLGIAVIDEQHRFGVVQREELQRKGYDVDTLVMTATPIPRSLALTAYGDLDLSTVDELPPGRRPIRTVLHRRSDRRGLARLIESELLAGHQGYVVYPLVEESEKVEDLAAATDMVPEWRAALPGSAVGLLHGRMASAEKEEVMAAFAAGDLRLLVATTVIEVGIDVANATIMVIEHADRFGLAQLHQLRGRVGRGHAPSTCVLVHPPRPSREAKQRLDVMARGEDGFAIAEKDLEIRGPGDFFGTRQSGIPTLRVSHLIRDRDLLALAQREARRYVDDSAELDPQLREFLEGGAWAERFGLARVG